jgi:Terminase large subunit, T4likevirus-type, N-terminal
MTGLARDLSRAFDPVLLARDCGYELDEWQANLVRLQPKRCILCCSRQAGKSLCSAFLGLHKALYSPGSLTIIASPSLAQSKEMLRTIRGLHAKLPGAELGAESVLKIELPNKSRILALCGDETSVRGFSGASLVILDEASRISDDLLQALTPMTATTDGAFIMLSTPAGRTGKFFEIWHDPDNGWHKISVAATDCPRITPEFRAEELKALGPAIFSQEYNLQFLENSAAAFVTTVIDSAFSADIQPLFAWS